jgi:hypothetical protein
MPDPSTTPREWADQLIASIDQDRLHYLAEDPLSAIPELFDLKLTLVGVSDDCPLHGTYFSDTRSVTVAKTASRGRVRFSALHELGHHLIRATGLRLDLEDYEEPAKMEESVCDAFAAAILLPDELVDEHIPVTGPTAADVVGLWGASNASRAAACVAASRRLPSPGYVMLCDLHATALFTAAHRTLFRVQADTPQGPDSIPAKAARNGSTYRGEGVLTFPSGSQSPIVQGDAAVSGEYVFCVFATTTAPWKKLNLLGERKAKRAPKPCPRCGELFVRWDNMLCQRCGEHRCPHCGDCGCRTVERDEAMCESCFLIKPARSIVNGVCTDCR